MKSIFNTVKLFLAGLLLINSVLAGPFCVAQSDLTELPLNQTPADQGEVTPTRYIKAHITNQKGRYILGPGDVVEIKVNDLPEFDQKLNIRPDGNLSVHPFGEYQVSGIDINGLELWLEERFKKYLLKPQVTVSVSEYRPAMVYVLGAVQRPGSYQFVRQGGSSGEKPDITVSNILAQAGGITDTADIQNIKIIHAATQAEEAFDLNAFIKSGVGEDLVLMPGDKIFVPQMNQPMDAETFQLVSRSTFYKTTLPVVVLGAVQKQGEVQVNVDNNSLNSALALAGGFNGTAKKGKILVQRLNAKGQFERFVIDRANQPFEMRPRDIVYVAESGFSKIEHVFKFMTSIAQGYFFSASGIQTTKNLQLMDEQLKTLKEVNSISD